MIMVHGIIGLVMILAVMLNNFFFHIQPFYSWYFPVIWAGYIFLTDAIVFRLKGKSLLVNEKKRIVLMFVLSAPFWWVFEGLNLFVQNWVYHNVTEPHLIFGALSFSTVVPAVFETSELMGYFLPRGLEKLAKIRLRQWKAKIVFIGILSLLLPIVFPRYFFPLIWLAFVFILDPINHSNKQPSIIGYLEKGNWLLPISFMLGALICGFFWEFWNYWAYPMWSYTIPFFDFSHAFEMPVLGYLGYLPFGLEIFAMYYFGEYWVRKIFDLERF